MELSRKGVPVETPEGKPEKRNNQKWKQWNLKPHGEVKKDVRHKRTKVQPTEKIGNLHAKQRKKPINKLLEKQ